MDNFTFYSPTLFAFGDGEEKNTGALVKRFGGTKVLLVCGGGSVKRSGLYDQLVSVLEQAGKTVIDFGGITSNPTYDMVLRGAETVKRENVDFILAVGGGSVMDCVKIISSAAKGPKDYWRCSLRTTRPSPAALLGARL